MKTPSPLIDEIKANLAALIGACTPEKQPTAETVELLKLCISFEGRKEVDEGRIEALEEAFGRIQPIIAAWEDQQAARAIMPQPLRQQRRPNLGP